MRNIILAVLVAVGVAGCAADPYIAFRDQNRGNVGSLHVGDPESTVTARMGTNSVKYTNPFNHSEDGPNYTNPYKREAVSVNNQNYDILYYYTEKIGNKSWEQGMTPVILSDGKVVGIGWRSMELLGLDSKGSITIRGR